MKSKLLYNNKWKYPKSVYLFLLLFRLNALSIWKILNATTATVSHLKLVFRKSQRQKILQNKKNDQKLLEHLTRKKHKHKEEWMKNVVVFFRCWWNDELIKSAAIYFDFCRLRVPMLMSIISFFCRLSLFFDFNIFSIISKCILEYVSVSLFARFLSFFARSIYHFTYHFYERKKNILCVSHTYIFLDFDSKHIS